MNIIMTGHKGLIGSFLQERLEREGHKIVLGIDKVEDREVGILDYLDLEDEKVDMLIHCAALCKINKIVDNPKIGFGNVDDINTVMEFCRKNKIKKVVYFSSSRVLSRERNAYTAGKSYGEEMCKAYRDCYGIEYIIIRPSTVYGPVEDRTNRLMNIFINNALDNKDLIIFGDPKTKTLDFTYVEDTVEGFVNIVNCDQLIGGTVNLGSGFEISIKSIAETINSIAGNSAEKIKYTVTRPGDVMRLYADASFLKSVTGWSPEISLMDGLVKTVEWFKSRPEGGSALLSQEEDINWV